MYKNELEHKEEWYEHVPEGAVENEEVKVLEDVVGNFDSALNFKKDSSAEVEKVMNNLSIVKARQKDDIPAKVIKMNKDIFAGFIAKDFSNCVDKGLFPDDLKHGDVTPVHKKKDKSDKPIIGL